MSSFGGGGGYLIARSEYFQLIFNKNYYNFPIRMIFSLFDSTMHVAQAIEYLQYHLAFLSVF